MSEILLVDDERSIRASMRAMLESEGFAVRTARSGDEAVRLFSERRPDVVLLDVMMPGKGGVQTCEVCRIQAIGSWCMNGRMFIIICRMRHI